MSRTKEKKRSTYDLIEKKRNSLAWKQKVYREKKEGKKAVDKTQATKGKQGLHLLAYYHRVGQQRQAIRLVFWNRKYREYLEGSRVHKTLDRREQGQHLFILDKTRLGTGNRDKKILFGTSLQVEVTTWYEGVVKSLKIQVDQQAYIV